MIRKKVTEDNIFSWLVGGSLALTALLSLVTALAISGRFAVSVLAGGILATANFLWIRQGLQAALNILPQNASRFALVRYLLRLALMAFLLYLLIVRFGADIFGLLLGLSVLVVNITAFSIFLSTRKGG